MNPAEMDETSPEQLEETGPQRTCIATGEILPKEGLIRFVLSPDNKVVPDLAEKLPGRGVWVMAKREHLLAAIQGKRFARAFRKPVLIDTALPEQVEAGLRKRALEWLSIVNKSGLAVVGFSKVEPLVNAGKAALLLQADDAGSDGEKLLKTAEKRGGEVSAIFSRSELGGAFGRDELVHIACKPGGATERLTREIRRAAGFLINDPI